MQQVHIAIIGGKGVGKSNFLRRYYEGSYNRNNVILLNHTMEDVFNTNTGRVNIKMTEYHDVTLIPNDISGIIVMFDVTNIPSFHLVTTYLEIATKITNNIVICGNKVDDKNRKVKWVQINKMCFPKYFDYSCRSNYNFDKPIKYLMKNIYGEHFNFLEQDQVNPPEVDMITMANFRMEMNNIANGLI